MQRVSKWASSLTPLLAVLLVFMAAVAWAYEAAAQATEPPQIKLQPPGGLTTQIRLNPPGGLTAQARLNPPGGLTAEARIQPPVGVTPQARMEPPGGAPAPDQQSLFDMIRIWLQLRLSVPDGR